MIDRTALKDLIRADAAARGGPVSRLGYFCVPFRPPDGPFADKVIKVYRGLRDDAALDRLAQYHDEYAAALRDHGVTLPRTEFLLLDMGGTRVPVIVQQALPASSMMRPQIMAADRDGAIALLEAAGEVIATFWTSAQGTRTRLGFHPSIRNFAVQDGRAIFFDTFPPLIHYSREEMGRMLLQFSDKRLMRMVGPLVRGRVTAIQDEWYSPPETLIGLVGSACRLRPGDAPAFLDWGRDFVRRRMAPWQDEALAGLAAPPRLPGYWTALRRMLGLQGEPNL